MAVGAVAVAVGVAVGGSSASPLPSPSVMPSPWASPPARMPCGPGPAGTRRVADGAVAQRAGVALQGDVLDIVVGLDAGQDGVRAAVARLAVQAAVPHRVAVALAGVLGILGGVAGSAARLVDPRAAVSLATSLCRRDSWCRSCPLNTSRRAGTGSAGRDGRGSSCSCLRSSQPRIVAESTLSIDAWAAAQKRRSAAAAPSGACLLCMARDRLGMPGLPGAPSAFEPWQAAHSTGRDPIRLVSSSLSCKVRMFVSVCQCGPARHAVAVAGVAAHLGGHRRDRDRLREHRAGRTIAGDQVGLLVGIPVLRAGPRRAVEIGRQRHALDHEVVAAACIVPDNPFPVRPTLGQGQRRTAAACCQKSVFPAEYVLSMMLYSIVTPLVMICGSGPCRTSCAHSVL